MAGAGGTVILNRWLPENEESRLPIFAHTMVGAGAIVKDDNDRILVVQERYKKVLFWKLPGGYVDPGDVYKRQVLYKCLLCTVLYVLKIYYRKASPRIKILYTHFKINFIMSNLIPGNIK